MGEELILAGTVSVVYGITVWALVWLVYRVRNPKREYLMSFSEIEVAPHVFGVLDAGGEVCHGRHRVYFSKHAKRWVVLSFTSKRDEDSSEEFTAVEDAIAAFLERSGMGAVHAD